MLTSSIITTGGLNAAFIRAMLAYQGGPAEVPWEADGGILHLWWGPTVPVAAGDVVSVFPSPHGLLFDRVRRADAD